MGEKNIEKIKKKYETIMKKLSERYRKTSSIKEYENVLQDEMKEIAKMWKENPEIMETAYSSRMSLAKSSSNAFKRLSGKRITKF